MSSWSKVLKILIRTNFLSTEKAIGFGNWNNVDATITRYYNVGFRHEVDHWITIKSIFKIPRLHEILSRANFYSIEKAIAFEKWNKYWEYHKSQSERRFSTRSWRMEFSLEHVFMIQSSKNFALDQFSLDEEGNRLWKLEHCWCDHDSLLLC